MTITTCGTCRFSTPALGADRKIDFARRLCKFLPPHPMLLPRPDGNGLTLQFIWPILDTGQNCGQWQGDARMVDTPLPGEIKPQTEKEDA